MAKRIISFMLCVFFICTMLVVFMPPAYAAVATATFVGYGVYEIVSTLLVAAGIVTVGHSTLNSLSNTVYEDMPNDLKTRVDTISENMILTSSEDWAKIQREQNFIDAQNTLAMYAERNDIPGYYDQMKNIIDGTSAKWTWKQGDGPTEPPPEPEEPQDPEGNPIDVNGVVIPFIDSETYSMFQQYVSERMQPELGQRLITEIFTNNVYFEGHPVFIDTGQAVHLSRLIPYLAYNVRINSYTSFAPFYYYINEPVQDGGVLGIRQHRYNRSTGAFNRTHDYFRGAISGIQRHLYPVITLRGSEFRLVNVSVREDNWMSEITSGSLSGDSFFLRNVSYDQSVAQAPVINYYLPETDPWLYPSIRPATVPTSLPEAAPLTYPDVVINPATNPNPNPDPGTDPGTDPDAEPAPDKEPGPGYVPDPDFDFDLDGGQDGLNFEPIIEGWGGLGEVFPFCLPWDLYNVVNSLVAPAEAPKWEIVYSKPPIYVREVIDLDVITPAVQVLRTLLIITFIFGLIKLTGHLIRH